MSVSSTARTTTCVGRSTAEAASRAKKLLTGRAATSWQAPTGGYVSRRPWAPRASRSAPRVGVAERRRGAEPQVDEAARPGEAAASKSGPQAAAGARRREREERVADRRGDVEDQPEDQRLKPDGTPARIDELGEEREQEERELRVESTDQKTIGIKAALRPPRSDGLVIRGLGSRQGADAEEHEVGRPEVLDEAEGLGRRGDDRGESHGGGEDLDQIAGLDAERRDQAAAAAVDDAARDDVDHRRTRQQHEARAGDREDVERLGAGHAGNLAAEPASKGRRQQSADSRSHFPRSLSAVYRLIHRERTVHV